MKSSEGNHEFSTYPSNLIAAGNAIASVTSVRRNSVKNSDGNHEFSTYPSNLLFAAQEEDQNTDDH